MKTRHANCVERVISFTCSGWSSGGDPPPFAMFIFSLIWKMVKAMVTQGAPVSTQAGLLTSSCSSWCLVFLAGTAMVLRAVAGLPTPLWLCTRSMVAMGTGLEGTGMFSASILSSEERGGGRRDLDLNAGLQKFLSGFSKLSGVNPLPKQINKGSRSLKELLCPSSSLQQPTSDQETHSLFFHLSHSYASLRMIDTS